MQAITTKYLGPTNTKGARIQAAWAIAAITIGYPHELTGVAVHYDAVRSFGILGDKNARFTAVRKTGMSLCTKSSTVPSAYEPIHPDSARDSNNRVSRGKKTGRAKREQIARLFRSLHPAAFLALCDAE